TYTSTRTESLRLATVTTTTQQHLTAWTRLDEIDVLTFIHRDALAYKEPRLPRHQVRTHARRHTGALRERLYAPRARTHKPHGTGITRCTLARTHTNKRTRRRGTKARRRPPRLVVVGVLALLALA